MPPTPSATNNSFTRQFIALLMCLWRERTEQAEASCRSCFWSVNQHQPGCPTHCRRAAGSTALLGYLSLPPWGLSRKALPSLTARLCRAKEKGRASEASFCLRCCCCARRGTAVEFCPNSREKGCVRIAAWVRLHRAQRGPACTAWPWADAAAMLGVMCGQSTVPRRKACGAGELRERQDEDQAWGSMKSGGVAGI